MPNKFITNLDLARQAEIFSGETAVFQGGIQLGIPFSGFPSGVDTSTITSIGVVDTQFAAFSGNTGTTVFNVTDPASPYYNATATTLSVSPYTVIDNDTITETVSATDYPTIMTFTALSGTSGAPLSISFTPPVIQELYNRGLYGTLFDGLGLASLGQTFIDESFYNDGSIFSGANLNMEIVEYAPHSATPAWVTGTTSGTVIEYSALTQYWTDTTIINGVSGLTLPITPESAETQTIDYVWTLTDSTIIDENVVGLEYTGYSVTYSFNDVIIDPESPSAVGATGATSADTYYLGTVTASLENFSAGTLDYKGSTNWLTIDGNTTVTERLTVDRLTINTLGTGSPFRMLAVDVNGNVVGGTGGTTDDVGAFTSTTGNNTIIPTNAASNTNDSDYASILAGIGNTISGSSLSYGAAITAGIGNEINGFSTASIIGGGQQNTISVSRSSIIGSKDSTINNTLFSFIGGGDTNTIDTSDFSAIVGGEDNGITGTSTHSSIIAGQGNSITGSSLYSSLLGGSNNDITNGIASSIIGGQNHNILNSSDLSIIVGGTNNDIINNSNGSGIFGGINNDIFGGANNSGIFGGINNDIDGGSYSAVIGGFNNTISGSTQGGFIVGGSNNTLDSNNSGVIGGFLNKIYDNGTYNLILGGDTNKIENGSNNSFIIGGTDNDINNIDYGGIIGGDNNSMGTGSTSSSIIGGDDNTIDDSFHSTIMGGSGNTLTWGFSIAPSSNGGRNAIISSENSLLSLLSGNTWNTVILGGQNNSVYDPNGTIFTQGTDSAIIGGDNNVLNVVDDCVIVGGNFNVMSGANHYQCVIVGGSGNQLTGTGISRSVIIGGQNITAYSDDTVYTPDLIVSGDSIVSNNSAVNNDLLVSGDADFAGGVLQTGINFYGNSTLPIGLTNKSIVRFELDGTITGPSIGSGSTGQRVILYVETVTAAGTTTISVPDGLGFTQIVFSSLADSVEMIYDSGNWLVLSSQKIIPFIIYY
jgi:hypothetical protein